MENGVLGRLSVFGATSHEPTALFQHRPNLSAEMLFVLFVELDVSHQLQAAVDDGDWIQLGCAVQEGIHHGADSRLLDVAHLVGHEIDPFHQTAAVDPFFAGVPTFH